MLILKDTQSETTLLKVKQLDLWKEICRVWEVSLPHDSFHAREFFLANQTNFSIFFDQENNENGHTSIIHEVGSLLISIIIICHESISNTNVFHPFLQFEVQ